MHQSVETPIPPPGQRVKSPTLSPGVIMWVVSICQIPHPQGQYFWSIDVNSLCSPGRGGGGEGGGFN